ncbi:N-acetylmuramoyl-L-alanine amidase [Ktedonobacter robiniae]|uniref:N-acetylmuramoyl-L-alanine amidase n=1 Tax=Ktedonobacter robiniae TaxID=2778365 RepID=A0ABQ3USW0_9CHLR|nr:peptidoglycan recognition family protein [Ktedonobacter robiniae]GHO55535.1 hypothetical protein KSB_40100 [Ktedonobacter robiniae]
MNIIQMPTSNFFPNRAGYKPKWLILHGTAGGSSAQGVAQGFINSQGGNNPVSTHYVIGQDGTVVQCVQEKDGAWGNGGPQTGCDPWWSTALNPNYVTISIEHVKPHTDNSDALTAAQQAASFALIREICDRWGIPKRKADKYGGITGHFSISPIDRARCPGTYPWQDLFNYLGDDMLQISDPFASTYFKQVSTNPLRWQCNNGFAVLGGLLDFYRKIGGALRLPKGNEQYNIPGVVWQLFEGGIAVYDPNGKVDSFHNPYAPCYLLKLDADLAKAILGITALQNQIAKLGNSTQLQTQLDAANKALSDAVAAKKASDDQLAAFQAQAQSEKAALQAQVDKEQAQVDQAAKDAAAAQAQVATLQNQIANAPDKTEILNDLITALQAAASKIA